MWIKDIIFKNKYNNLNTSCYVCTRQLDNEYIHKHLFDAKKRDVCIYCITTRQKVYIKYEERTGYYPDISELETINKVLKKYMRKNKKKIENHFNQL